MTALQKLDAGLNALASALEAEGKPDTAAHIRAMTQPAIPAMYRKDGTLTAYALACGYIQHIGTYTVRRVPGMRLYLVLDPWGKSFHFKQLDTAYAFAGKMDGTN